jgi:hypothetical protein
MCSPGPRPPEPLDAAILFAPAGDLVPVALEALDSGGTLSIAGVHLSRIPALDYERQLFRERTVRSVTANTRQDGRDFFAAAARHRLRATVTPYDFEHADTALDDLAAGRVKGVAVLLRCRTTSRKSSSHPGSGSCRSRPAVHRRQDRGDRRLDSRRGPGHARAARPGAAVVAVDATFPGWAAPPARRRAGG